MEGCGRLGPPSWPAPRHAGRGSVGETGAVGETSAEALSKVAQPTAMKDNYNAEEGDVVTHGSY